MRYTDALSTHTSQAANKTLRNTYGLLSLTLLFSAFTAGLSMVLNLPHPGLIITLVGFYGLLFLTHKCQNSALGLLCVFALTGFMGLTLGPILNAYLSMSNGASMIMSALGTTGLSFLGLSAYAIVSKKDFSFLNGFLTVGFFALLGDSIFRGVRKSLINSRDRYFILGLTGSFIALLVHGFVETILDFAPIMVLFWLLMGIYNGMLES